MPRLHVLLIGIDAYRGADAALSGCVNDIDAIQRLLLGPRMNVPAADIQRLAAPRDGAAFDATIPAELPTLANVRSALHRLGRDEIAPDDRIFIYYSGHGARGPVMNARDRVFYREALVPCDADPGRGEGLLFDFEVNALLAAITRRTTSVTVVLDCCHAGGVTRSGMRPRCHPEDWRAPSKAAARVLDLEIPQPIGAIDACSVVTACQADQRAYEDGERPVRHGLFTQALLDELDATDRELHTLPWSTIWEGIRDRQTRRNAGQNPAITGSRARAVFAGPPVASDPGLPVTQEGDVYRIAAGTLADVTVDTELAIYGELPLELPALGSVSDAEQRVGLLRVTRAERASATAVGSFALPAGPRARITRLGERSRLTCALVPYEPRLAAEIAMSPLLQLVPDREAAVTLERVDQRWILADVDHGIAEPQPVLFALRPDELDRARALLEHYHTYSRPLRLAQRAGDLPGLVKLTMLACPETLAPTRATSPDLSEVPRGQRPGYQVEAGTRVCFRVDNGWTGRLRVTLVNVAASGRVQMIGDGVVDDGASHVFWAGGQGGQPFEMSLPDGVEHGLDRMVAIGRTAMTHDLGYLALERTFADAVERRRDTRAPKDLGGGPTLDRWTSAQIVIETRALAY